MGNPVRIGAHVLELVATYLAASLDDMAGCLEDL